MRTILSNKYIISYLVIYFLSLFLLYFGFHRSLTDLLPVFFCFGILLSIIAWFLVKDCVPSVAEKPAFRNEWMVIIFLVLYFLFYVTYGTSYINKLLPASVTEVAWKNEIAITVKKLTVFVVIPFLIYKLFGFSLTDFGLRLSRKKLFNRKTVMVFVILSAAALLFQYFLSGGARPVREGQFTATQLIIGLPLAFLWLFIEAGLVEEFFFRALLQSRIAALLQSQIAGIIISGLIFGLAHAPGLFLRGAESEGISESLPFYYWMAYTICAMSLAGIFLGIVWNRTKNLYLVIGIHAMVDLLPNIDDFIRTWGL